MPTVDFLPFATGGGANVESQAAYAADPTTGAGFSAGIAQSSKLNKVWRQASVVTSAIANFIANTLGIDVLDDGNSATLIANLTAAIKNSSVTQGQCQLQLSDATHLILIPYSGNRVFIPSSGSLTLPAGGVLCAVGSALVEGGAPAANTVYYAYLSATGGGTLQLSATAPAVDATTGFKIRTGDNTRLLVGLIRTSAATQFVDSGSQRFIASYFNPLEKTGVNVFTTNVTTSSTAYVELNSSARVEFVTFGDRAVDARATGSVNSNTSDNPQTSIGFDGTSPEETYNLSLVGPANAPICVTVVRPLTEGYHYATILGSSFPAAQTQTWAGSATKGERCSLAVTIKG